MDCYLPTAGPEVIMDIRATPSKPVQKLASRKKILIETMQTIDRNERDFRTHSLRIGAHTVFITYGLPDDFVEFLSRRQTSKASLRHYRAAARLTICKGQKFIKNTDVSRTIECNSISGSIFLSYILYPKNK